MNKRQKRVSIRIDAVITTQEQAKQAGDTQRRIALRQELKRWERKIR